jgi:hypothetical protein
MSTKSSLAYGPYFHLYSEMGDEENIYLELEGVEFEVSDRRMVVAIPAAVWEVIRQHTAVDLSFADKSDDDIQQLVESAVHERTMLYAQASEPEKKYLKLSGVIIYGAADSSQGAQIARGWEYYTRLRRRQTKIKQNIEALSKMRGDE